MYNLKVNKKKYIIQLHNNLTLKDVLSIIQSNSKQIVYFVDKYKNNFSGFIIFGCVIRGATSHYDLVVNVTSSSVYKIVNKDKLPLAFCLLTVENYQQAIHYSLDSISKFTNSKIIIYILTWLYTKEGLITDAEALNRQMNQGYEEQYHILELLAFGKIIDKNYKEAIVIYKNLLKMEESKDKPIWYFYFGYAFDLNSDNKVFAEKFYRHYLKTMDFNEDKHLEIFIKERLRTFNK